MLTLTSTTAAKNRPYFVVQGEATGEGGRGERRSVRGTFFVRSRNQLYSATL